ncbi:TRANSPOSABLE ELEMENT-RELATED [Ceraceosorus bombacis]|uniref:TRANSPOSABLE ELEMENT-RELATED n=1 Tax=Ceraceosorus bombacis TaxID=401625 RepID=A0A0P1BPM9_9BASI|nr:TRANSPOSABLE ELEMENT-RELATED [Ceraceosorus bombacis]
MVWAGISKHGQHPLYRFDTSKSTLKKGGVNATIYREQITQGKLRDYFTGLGMIGGHPTLVEDNAPVHTAKLTKEMARQLGYTPLPHPPNSPDLNPIENCWAWLKNQLKNSERSPKNEDELFEKAQELWAKMPQSLVDRCIDSMEGRLKAVKRTRGFATHY